MEDYHKEFIEAKEWKELKPEQKEDLIVISLNCHTLISQPCGFGKSIYYEYFAFSHAKMREKRGRRREKLEATTTMTTI